MEQKQLVEDKRLPVYLDDIFDDKTIEEAIDELIKISNGMTGELHKFRLSYDYDDYSESIKKLHLISYRYETDKEYERRLKNKQKAKEEKAKIKAKREELEKKEYDRLKAKYEK
jgi:hypothetical protein